MFFVHNSTSQTATFTQGSGGNVNVPAGAKALYMQMVQDLVQKPL